MRKKYAFLAPAILILISFVAFGRVLSNEFVSYDDNVYITENHFIQSGINPESIVLAFTTTHAANWHPLTWLSHMLDWQLFGADATGHHLVNLIFHLCSVFLLFLFLNKTTGYFWPSLFAAALFALHPLRVESVAWAAERKDVLSMFLGLATLYVYGLYVEKAGFSKYIFCLALFALGLMAKPMLVTLPFVLLLLDFWPLRRWQKPDTPLKAPEINPSIPARRKSKKKQMPDPIRKIISKPVKNNYQLAFRILWEKLPFVFLTIISCGLTIWGQNKGGAVASLQQLPFIERAANIMVSYVAYLWKIFWPVNLAVFYPYQNSLPAWQVIGAAVIILAISFWAIYNMKKTPYIFVGWFWYLGTLIPVIGLMQVGSQAMADRYTYLPSIGIAIMLVWGLFDLIKSPKARKKILLPAGLIILLCLVILTWRQSGYWKNSIALFSHALYATSDNYLAHDSLGVALDAAGQYQEAISHYQAAIQINPFYATPHINMGVMFARQGKLDAAVIHYREAIAINPSAHQAHCNLGTALAAQGKIDEAIDQYQAAIKIMPANADAHYNLANALNRQSKIEEAIHHYLVAVQNNPDYEDAHYNLADLYARQGKIEEAIAHFRQVLRINSSSFRALNNLGVCLEKQLKHDEAIFYYRKALQIEPQNPGGHFNLGVALGNKGDLKEAIVHFRLAVDLNPDDKVSRQALDMAQRTEQSEKH